MSEPVYNYKVIIASKTSFSDKEIDKPKYFDQLEEVKEHIKLRKKEIKENNREIWFVKVWEFGKEDYIDMDLNF